MRVCVTKTKHTYLPETTREHHFERAREPFSHRHTHTRKWWVNLFRRRIALVVARSCGAQPPSTTPSLPPRHQHPAPNGFSFGCAFSFIFCAPWICCKFGWNYAKHTHTVTPRNTPTLGIHREQWAWACAYSSDDGGWWWRMTARLGSAARGKWQHPLGI